MNGFETVTDRRTYFRTVTIVATVAAVVCALITLLSLLLIGAFLNSNIVVNASREIALLVAGIAATIGTIPLNLVAGGRILRGEYLPWSVLTLMGLSGTAALIWSLWWLPDIGDWPFFGAAPLIYAIATFGLLVRFLTAGVDN